MQNKFEELIKTVYKEWKSGQFKTHRTHPDEEALACFLEGKLSQKENEGVMAHLMGCASCSENLAIQAKLKVSEEKEVPQELLGFVKDLLTQKDKFSILEILLRLKEKTLELLNTTGDVLVGQEFMPAPVLRSRKIQDFKDEVTILKDFQDIRVEVKVENKQGKAFSLTVIAKEKKTQQIIKDLRITLLKEDLELESYVADSGRVTFENVLLGKYTVEISDIENKLASIVLDIKT